MLVCGRGWTVPDSVQVGETWGDGTCVRGRTRALEPILLSSPSPIIHLGKSLSIPGQANGVFSHYCCCAPAKWLGTPSAACSKGTIMNANVLLNGDGSQAPLIKQVFLSGGEGKYRFCFGVNSNEFSAFFF